MELLAPQRVTVRPPRLHFSSAIPAGMNWQPLIDNVSSGYEAPAVLCSDPEDLIVNGRTFNVVSAARGVVMESVHLTDQFRLKDFFDGVAQTTCMDDAGKAMLVAGNIFAHNYYHWTMQCLAAILLYRLRVRPREGAIATPGLLPMMVETLGLHGVEMGLLQIDPGQIAVISGGLHTNLMGLGFTHFPHPQVIRLLREPLGRIVPSRAFGKRLYVSRRDSANRRLMNEADVEARMVARGFDILQLSGLSVADQMAAFRDAEVIVAPHGAGLTNLIYCDVARAPAKVIELAQSSFVNMCFIRIGQVLGLDYTFILNPTDPWPEDAPPPLSDDTTWRADLPLLDRVLEEAGV